MGATRGGRITTPPRLWTYRDLRATYSRRRIAVALAAGHLIRLRKGTYVAGGIDPEVRAAAELGGRVDCLCLMELLGVFVRSDHRLHVQMNRTSTRVPPRTAGTARHWRRTAAHPRHLLADVVEAVAQACRCQDPLSAIATLDSALHTGNLAPEHLEDVLALLPARFGALRKHVDGRSEAGTETILRVLLRRKGWRVEVQVRIDGVGRVDLLIDGWLIVECDSETFHGGWAQRRRDLRRDLAAARRGYTTVRPIAEDILWHVDDVVASIDGLLRHRRG